MIINPDNVDVIEIDGKKYFPKEIADNVPRFIRTFSLFCLTIGSLGVLLIREPHSPEKEVQSASINSDVAQRAKEQPATEVKIPKITMKDFIECVKDRIWQHLFVSQFIGFMYCHFVMFSFKQIGLNHLEKADQFINTSGRIAAIFNAGVRFAIAFLYVKTSYRTCALTILFIQVTSALTFIWAADKKETYLPSLSYFFLTYGGQLGLYPLVT